MAYALYLMLFVISTAGAARRISKMVSEAARWGTMPTPGDFSAWGAAPLWRWGPWLAFDALGARYYGEHIIKTRNYYAFSPFHPAIFLSPSIAPSAGFSGDDKCIRPTFSQVSGASMLLVGMGLVALAISAGSPSGWRRPAPFRRDPGFF
jgi:hypothetical protein